MQDTGWSRAGGELAKPISPVARGLTLVSDNAPPARCIRGTRLLTYTRPLVHKTGMRDWHHIQRRLAEVWPKIKKYAPDEPYSTKAGGRTAFEGLLGRLYFNIAASQDLNEITHPYKAKGEEQAAGRYIAYFALNVRMRKAYYPNAKKPREQPLTRMWGGYLRLLDDQELAIWVEAFRRCHYLENPPVRGLKIKPGLPIVKGWFRTMERTLNERLPASKPHRHS